MRNQTPDGWKLVPIVPTEDMCKAYHKANEHYHTSSSGWTSPDYQWKCMLAAAPEAPTHPNGKWVIPQTQKVIVTVCYREGCSDWEPIEFPADASDHIIEESIYESLYHEIHSNPGFRSYSWKRVQPPKDNMREGV